MERFSWLKLLGGGLCRTISCVPRVRVFVGLSHSAHSAELTWPLAISRKHRSLKFSHKSRLYGHKLYVRRKTDNTSSELWLTDSQFPHLTSSAGETMAVLTHRAHSGYEHLSSQAQPHHVPWGALLCFKPAVLLKVSRNHPLGLLWFGGEELSQAGLVLSLPPRCLAETWQSEKQAAGGNPMAVILSFWSTKMMQF